jgi:phosphoglycolate phosphatase
MPAVTYKAVIFDLDGTLLNTLEDLMAAVNHSLRQLGFPIHGPAEFKYFVGAGRDVMAALALPADRRSPEMVSRLCQEVDAYYLQHWMDNTRPYPGIPELLNALTGRGVRMAVLSNKPHNFTVLNISELLAPWHFEAVMGATPTGPKKPDCTSALQIARQMGVAPVDFLYLGDSDIDMQTAINACMYPIGALWGFRTAEELKAAGAKTLVRQPLEVLDLLN